MKDIDELEIWVDGAIYASISTSFQPMIGEIVSIRKLNYRVLSRNFSLDYSDDWQRRHMRLAINVQKIEAKPATKKIVAGKRSKEPRLPTPPEQSP